MSVQKRNKKDSIDERLEAVIKKLEVSKFHYYNLNPSGHHTGDCVVRAIAAAEGMTWEEVARDLYDYMLKYKYFINSTELYEIYLKDKGWTKHRPPKKKGGTTYHLNEWIEKTKGKPIIVTIDDDHLTYIVENKLYDIWDCLEHTVGEYWTYEE